MTQLTELSTTNRQSKHFRSASTRNIPSSLNGRTLEDQSTGYDTQSGTTAS